jgi:hypothetical protein
VPGQDAEGAGRYAAGLARTTARGWTVVAASQPTVGPVARASRIVRLARRSWMPGRHSGALFGRAGPGISRVWTVPLGVANAVLGLLVVTLNLQLAK